MIRTSAARVLRFSLNVFALMTAMTLSAEIQTAPKVDERHIVEIRKILKEVPLIDGHNDVPWQYRKRSNDFSAINLREDTGKLESPMVTDIPRLREGGLGGQFWSVYIPATMSGPEAVKAVIEQIDVVHHMM